MLQHRRGFVNHNQRGNAGIAGFGHNTVHDVTDDGRRKCFVLENMRKVKSHKTLGTQIQTVVFGIENITVLVRINPAEKLPAHIAGRRKTAFVEVFIMRSSGRR